MDIVCPQCKTEYEFEDDKVTEAGVTVKCTSCDFTFKVRRRIEEELEDDEERPWLIRRENGDVMTFHELTTLQQWIVEQKVSSTDEISRGGEAWRPLGEIPELSSFFDIVEAANRPAKVKKRRERSSVQPLPKLEASEPAFTTGMGPAIEQADTGATAAWEGSGARLGRTPTVEARAVKRGSGGRILPVLFILLLLGGGAFAYFKRHQLKHFVGSLFGRSAKVDAYSRGRTLFLKGGEENLLRADSEYAKAPRNDVRARAARGEVFTVLAQYLKDQAQLVDDEAKLLETKLSTGSDPKLTSRGDDAKGNEALDEATEGQAQIRQRVAQLRKLANKLRTEASEHVGAAAAHLDAAMENPATRAEVFRAAADLHRLRGEADAKQLIARAQATAPNDAESHYVDGLIASNDGDDVRAAELQQKAINLAERALPGGLLRARFQLALTHYRAGRTDEALNLTQSILKAAPMHRWAKVLQTRLQGEPSEAEPITQPLETNSKGPTEKQSGPQTTATHSTANTTPSHKNSKTSEPKTSEPKTSTPKTASTPNATNANVGRATYHRLITEADKHSEHGRTMRAIKLYDRALKAYPEGAEAILGMGFCELDLQRFSAAIRSFKKAMGLRPGYGEAMIGLAEAYKAMGSRRKALDYYRAYVQAHPGGSKASFAKRNIKQLEREFGESAPKPKPKPVPEPDPNDSSDEPAQPSNTPDTSTNQSTTETPEDTQQPGGGEGSGSSEDDELTAKPTEPAE